MKKIHTMFERVYGNHKVVDILPNFTSPDAMYALHHGIATVKVDGSCCAIFNGVLYKRYDAKNGKQAPEGAVPCCEADPVTGHHPHWVRVDPDNPSDKWFLEARKNYPERWIMDGTYEAVGPHFNGNPYRLERDSLIRHGVQSVFEVERTFEGVKRFLTEHLIEGLVFWVNNEPVCKIKRTDFGLPWPVELDGSLDTLLTRLCADPLGYLDDAQQICPIAEVQG